MDTTQHQDGSICSPHWPYSFLCSSDNEDGGSNFPSLLSPPLFSNDVPLVDPIPPAASGPFQIQFLPVPGTSPASSLTPQVSPAPTVPAQKRKRHHFLRPMERRESQATRAEKNRRFARESRERKQRYVAQLETEVVSLRDELAHCKQQFARYELIERLRTMVCAEENYAVRSAFDEIARTGADSSQFSRIVVKNLDALIMERKKALEQLSRMVLEITAPLPLRFAFWEAESNLDMYDPQNLCRHMGYKLDGNEVKILAEHLKTFRADQEEARRTREAIAAVSRNVRKKVKQMLECQRDMEREIMKVIAFARKIFQSKYTSEFAAKELMFAPKLNGRPELTDQAIFQVRDQDLSLETNMDEASCAIDCCAGGEGCVAR